MPITYPQINGNRYDFSSVQITVAGLKIFGVKSINYKGALDPGEVRGNHAQIIGSTRGKYTAEGSIEIYKLEFSEMVRVLGFLQLGFMEVRFDVDVHYNEPGQDVITDKLRAVRIKSHEDSPAEGNDPSTTKCDLHIGLILPANGPPMHPKQMLL